MLSAVTSAVALLFLFDHDGHASEKSEEAACLHTVQEEKDRVRQGKTDMWELRQVQQAGLFLSGRAR